VQVTCYRCVPDVRTEKVTVLVARQVPYEATRTVCVCVPHQETVTLTRLVARVVEKQVPVTTAAYGPGPCECAPACDTCAPKCCPTHKVRRLRLRKGHGCCD
jgi:hypothetical protein